MRTNRDVINGWMEMVSEKQGKLSQDKEWSHRLVYYYLKMYKVRLLWDKKNKKIPIARATYMALKCFELEKIDMSECPCIPASGCTFQRSKVPIPNDITGAYQSVTSILGNKTYEYLRWDEFEDRLNSRFPAERIKPYYTIKSFGEVAYLYIYSDNDKEVVSATLIPVDNLEVLAFPNCGKPVHICDPLDREFVIDDELLPILYEMVFDKLIKVKSTAQPELFNNEEPDSAKRP